MTPVQKDLNKINNEIKEDLNKQLAISQTAGESYDSQLHALLKNTLGMTSSTTTKDLENKRQALEVVGIKREVIAEFSQIQSIFGDKPILDYASLLNLCKINNLYFGSTALFSGEITPEAIEECKSFDFIKAKTMLYVGIKYLGKSVIDWHFDAMGSYDLLIVAPITMFNLGTEDKKILISNREIIEHEKGTHYMSKRNCPEKDPVLLLPFRSKDKAIYFIVITNWES